MEMDHLVPISRGGTNARDNLVLACFACNRSKGGKLLAEWQAERARRGETARYSPTETLQRIADGTLS
jgi:5-methylcytosine-specific restriction endonuclease McrA